MVELKYVYKEIPNIDSIKEISNKFNINQYIAAILIQNLGYNVDKIHDFLEPSLEKLYDPFLIIKKTEGRMAEDDFWIRIEE